MQENDTLISNFNFNIGVLGYLTLGFELICATLIVVLFSFAWYFNDPQSLIIPSVLTLCVLPLLDLSRRYISKGNVAASITTSCIVSWISALVIGFFASIVPVIFAASAMLSFVPVIIATTTTTDRILLRVSAISTLICCICGVFVTLPGFLPEGVPAEVIGRLIAIFVPLLLGISSLSLWYGNRRLHTSLQEAEQANFALAEKYHLEIELEEQKRMEQQARHSAEKADLEKLRYQLNPHFLFNSLTSIRGAIRKDAATAREMVTVLAEFCRLTLMRGSSEIQPLSDEIETIRLYVKMEQTRSRDNLAFNLNVAPGIGDFLMPAFVIQPLIENALKYGRQTSQGPLQINVIISKLPTDGIHILVSNTGCWVNSTSNMPPTSTRTGLRNLRQRLIRHYSDETQLVHHERDGSVFIDILLPYSLIEERNI